MVAQGGGSAADMAALLEITRQAVEKQLRVLEEAGSSSACTSAGGCGSPSEPRRWQRRRPWLSSLADTWDRRLAAVKALAEA